ncbi:hypothetical protein HAX54_004666, partial [Datura stramonium]|nr:hypothetical protein [Datura stramonium]
DLVFNEEVFPFQNREKLADPVFVHSQNDLFSKECMPPLQFTAPNHSQAEGSIMPLPQNSQLNTDQLEATSDTN